MKKSFIVVCLAMALLSAAFAGEGPTPKGVPHLDHVFVIMMENHGYSQIVGNPNAPFTNQFAKYANTGNNYFAIAHPSLTNYLELVGGSNFAVLNDNSPDWGNGSCTTNLNSTPSLDNGQFGPICPISGGGTDAATPPVDYSNETSGPPGENNIDGIRSIPAANNILGKSIGDQLVEHGLSWKSYQESLPLSGAAGVNNSDGYYTDHTDFTKILPTLNPALTTSDVVSLYAVKHNPFAYFKSVQDGDDPRNSLSNVVAFEGAGGLWSDLGSGRVPALSFIAPNQCHDQHGRGNGGAFCNFDPSDDGSQAGLNPALIYLGDVTVQRIVTAIHSSPAWRHGNNAIVVLWDENDYSLAPNTNQVLFIVDTNYGPHGRTSGKFYTHFSLLRTLEGGFGLPCLNHACDSGTAVITDLFGGHGRD